MDLKSLIAKMDQIESKKFLTESEKKETSWTDMKGNKHGATKVKGKSYGNQPEPKEVDDEGKPKKKVKEGLGIADALMEAFGLQEQTLGSIPASAPSWADDVTIDGKKGVRDIIANPYTGADAQKFARLTPQDQEWLTRGGQKPDINDPFIMRRAPNKGKLAEPVQSTQPAPDFSKQDAEIDVISKEFDKLNPTAGGAQSFPVPDRPNIVSTPLPPLDNSGQQPSKGATQSAQPAATPAATPAAKPAASSSTVRQGQLGPTKAAAAGQDPNNPLNKLSSTYTPQELERLIALMSKMPN